MRKTSVIRDLAARPRDQISHAIAEPAPGRQRHSSGRGGFSSRRTASSTHREVVTPTAPRKTETGFGGYRVEIAERGSGYRLNEPANLNRMLGNAVGCHCM